MRKRWLDPVGSFHGSAKLVTEKITTEVDFKFFVKQHCWSHPTIGSVKIEEEGRGTFEIDGMISCSEGVFFNEGTLTFNDGPTIPFFVSSTSGYKAQVKIKSKGDDLLYYWGIS